MNKLCVYCEMREALEKADFCSLDCERAFEIQKEHTKRTAKERVRSAGQIYGN